MIKKAIIPVAGFGTRLYPATRGIKKEFCPVVDRDGLLKPVILILVEELIYTGIEEICFIISPSEKQFYEDFFKNPISDAHYAALKPEMKEYEDGFKRLADKIQFVLQTEQKGFGHAVYQAKCFAADDPVLLLLGDTIYRSNTDESCTGQLIRTFDLYDKPMVAVYEVPISNVSGFGIFAGTWKDAGETVIDIERIVEKPTPEYAKENLGMIDNRGNTVYMGAFGAYILNKDVFSELEKMITEHESGHSKREVELTVALEHVMKSKGMLAFVPDGESFDMGNVKAYQRTFTEFAR